MKLQSAILLGFSTCAELILANPNPLQPESPLSSSESAAIALALAGRAFPNSPSGGYAPGNVTCPSTRPTIRSASSLSPNETAWLQLRRNATIAPMIDLLTRNSINGFDAAAYIETHKNNASALPNIGIAVSGGGYRALMNGGGFLAAADSRTINSTVAGGIGGLLQSATYLAGLSGGGWLVGSIYTNNFSSVQTLRDGSEGSAVWQFDNSIFEGPQQSGFSIVNTATYYSDILSQVDEKRNAGYNISITDYWGRALSYQLVNATDGGPAYTFSSIALTDSFQNGETPMPFLVADGRAPGTVIISLNSTVFEFNPFEMGSWDPTTYGFAPTRYLGSSFNAGTLPSNASCVEGFDQVGFIMGTSSSLFNQFLLLVNDTTSSLLVNALKSVAENIGEDNNDIAQYQPNPFYHFNNASNISSNVELSLVDGGEDLQNIPLYPLIQPSRAVDVIFAIDSSADTTYLWPNGTALVATYERSHNAIYKVNNNTAFASIPDQNTIVNLGLNQHPTFFGCDAANTTTLTPLIVYIPNAPYITQSNVSTFDPSYNDTQRNLIIRNGYDVATMGNGTLDAEWPVCVSCAILSRSFYKTQTEVPAACTTCFARYCWNGTINSTVPNNYDPAFKITEVSMTASSASRIRGGWMTVLVVVAVVSALCVI